MSHNLSSEALARAQKLDADANTHLLQGLALLEANTPGSLRDAVECCNAAIALRKQLPLATHPWYRYGLIAGWLNRGDALTRLGTPAQLLEALHSFDEGLRELRQLPMHESPLFVQRLAIAWLNRGVALLAFDTARTTTEAAANFAEAIAAAKNFARQSPAEGRRLLAGAWVNRSNALIRLDPPNAAAAHAAAKETLALTATDEKADVSAAAITFKALHVLCQATAEQLAKTEVSSPARAELLAEATDAVDRGLALARHWQACGETRFNRAMTDLFRFGCRAFQLHQPHFLTEFLLENLDPTKTDATFAQQLSLHECAAESLWHTLAAVHRDSFRQLNTPQLEKTLALFGELRVTRDRLAQLQQRLQA